MIATLYNTSENNSLAIQTGLLYQLVAIGSAYSTLILAGLPLTLSISACLLATSESPLTPTGGQEAYSRAWGSHSMCREASSHC